MDLFMDAALARRLERCEGAINASFTETHARLDPTSGSAWIDVAGAYAMYDGPDSPMTQTFGLGMFAAVGDDELARIEAFFTERGAATDHELSSLAGVALSARLVDRGYRPIEQSTVLVQVLGAAGRVVAPSGVAAAVTTPEQKAAWVECSIAGWVADPASAAVMRGIVELAFTNPAMTSYHVAHEGALVATGSLGVHEGVAMLAGASTVPAFRGRGAQGALLAARLDAARARGAELAMMVTEPGSTSQHNAERNGFRVAYTRTKWRRPVPA